MGIDIGRRQLVVATLSLAAGASSFAQTYPARTIRLMVGFPPGGGVDSVARLLAPRLSKALGQQLIVDNRSGASGALAGDLVAKAPPDGYTLLVGESGLLIAKYLQGRLPFDPIESFLPVGGLFSVPLMIIANKEFPASNPGELLAVLKANPGKYAYGTPGVGTVQHLAFEMLKARAGVFAVHIPYRGAAQFVPDVVGGQLPLGVVSVAAGVAQVKAGKVRALAMMSPVRIAGAEEVRPLSDALPGFSAAPRLSLLAPAGTPEAVRDRLAEALRVTLADAELVQAAELQGVVPAFMAGAAFRADLLRESAQWEKVIRDQGIRAE
jgi:tripartite-type tricarboxylate transporter receptor subunit TctC